MIDYKTVVIEDLEGTVGEPVNIEGKNLEKLIEIYESLLIKACIVNQQWSDADLVDKENLPFSAMIDWLRLTDFYKAPASTRYHDSMMGGLLIHSLKVYNESMKLLKLDKFSSISPDVACIVALVHDWCKIGYYESYQKNVKDESTGQWVKETAYRTNQKGVPLGHGVTSLYLVMRLLRIDTEMALAIRWHMGRWDGCDPELHELQLANSSYPLVYLLQFADQLACVKY